MAILTLPLSEPETEFGGTLCQSPRSQDRRVGAYTEVVDTSGSSIDLVCVDGSTEQTVDEYISSKGLLRRGESDPSGNDRAVKERIDNHDPIFTHLFVVQDGYEPTFEDWLDVALVDGSLPDKESGWDLDGTAVHLYDLATSMRDAVALGKAQRSMEAVGGDTSIAQIVQRVHDEVEAPISLMSEHIHGDQEYRLFQPGAIYQTMFTALADNRHEAWDRSTHFPEINLTQS